MMTVVAPHQSIRTLRLILRFGRCKNRNTMARAMMPIGMLIRKTQRHPVMNRMEGAPANSPPMSGPMTLEMPKTARK